MRQVQGFPAEDMCKDTVVPGSFLDLLSACLAGAVTQSAPFLGWKRIQHCTTRLFDACHAVELWRVVLFVAPLAWTKFVQDLDFTWTPSDAKSDIVTSNSTEASRPNSVWHTTQWRGFSVVCRQKEHGNCSGGQGPLGTRGSHGPGS